MSTNVSRPAGCQVVRHLTGGVIRANRHHIASGLAQNIFRGDLVIPTVTSKNITLQAAVGDRVIGVFDGVSYIAQAGDIIFSPRWVSGTTVQTGTVPDAFVYDDPRLLFEIQASGAFALADIGALANPTFAVAGNALTGQSGQQLDSATIGSGAVFKIYDYSRRADNFVNTNAKLIVALSLHYHDGAMTAI